MTQLKICPVGNSLGVVLPREVLSRLNLKSGDSLHLVEAPDGSMRITPYDPEFETQMRYAREGMSGFRNALTRTGEVKPTVRPPTPARPRKRGRVR
jgi:putative addiction module antidote